MRRRRRTIGRANYRCKRTVNSDRLVSLGRLVLLIGGLLLGAEAELAAGRLFRPVGAPGANLGLVEQPHASAGRLPTDAGSPIQSNVLSIEVLAPPGPERASADVIRRPAVSSARTAVVPTAMTGRPALRAALISSAAAPLISYHSRCIL